MRRSLPARQRNAFSEMFLESIWMNFPSEAALLWQRITLPAMRAECELISSSNGERLHLILLCDARYGQRRSRKSGMRQGSRFFVLQTHELGSSQTNA